MLTHDSSTRRGRMAALKASHGLLCVIVLFLAPQATQAACSAQLGSTFEACAQLSGLDFPLEFSWTFDSTTRKLSAAITGSSPTGWFSVGFTDPSQPGRMANSNCVLVIQDASASTGAVATGYWYQGHDSGTVGLQGLTLLSSQAAASTSNLTTIFSLVLPDTYTASALGIIYGYGPVGGDGSPQTHDRQNGLGATIDVITSPTPSPTPSPSTRTTPTPSTVTSPSASTTPTPSTSTATSPSASTTPSTSISTAASPSTDVTVISGKQTVYVNRETRVHGWVSAVGVGLLMPLTMILARRFKEYNPAWFHLHRIIGVLSFAGAIAGGVLGFQLTLFGKLGVLHEAFGISVMALASLQVSAILLRPNKGHAARGAWEFMHFFAGRAAIALGIANVYIGLNIQGESATYYIAYSAVLGALVLVWFGKELIDILSHPGKLDPNSARATELANQETIRAHGVKGNHVNYSHFAPERTGAAGV